MPKRTDISKIMVIGSGPIVIGQGCEFDYSGTQAVKALKEEGYEVVLVNSNPATIMTDPNLADRTYIEPIDPNIVAEIIRKERPCALLPTLGGQTALNTALTLSEMGVLKECNVELLGADIDVIRRAESRELFGDCMRSIGLAMPASEIAHDMDSVRRLAATMPFPIIVRPGFTLGGAGGGIAYNSEDLEEIAARGLAASISHEILLEQSVLGWKELEIEIIRDRDDVSIVVCTIENFDPMGVHTGDSITVAPALTLSEKEVDKLISTSKDIMRAVGMKGGGANIQYAMHQTTGELVVIEMNPRVSRSSALASKATGVPIARISAKLAVGYTLSEIPGAKFGETMADYKADIDYIVAKIPRFAFEKFPGAKDELTTAMKSVGEIMSIGKSFQEAMQKGLRSLEVKATGFSNIFKTKLPEKEEILAKLRVPNSQRIFYLRLAMLSGMSIQELYEITSITPWFLEQLKELLVFEQKLEGFALANSMTSDNEELGVLFKRAKELGFSDAQLSEIWKRPEADIRSLRKAFNILPSYYPVRTYAGKIDEKNTVGTPYFYSSYVGKERPVLSDQKKVIILGGGPNRIGQGIEFDYCCCHASFVLKELGVCSIMVNSNPETVSTDFDSSDRLYFEPLTFEDVMNIIEFENPYGVVVQFGGQTPLNLAVPLFRAGVNILGSSPDAIDRAEDRERFVALITKLGLRQPASGTAFSFKEAALIAEKIGYPVVVRPSYVLGGRAMMVVYDEAELNAYFVETVGQVKPEHPILIDHFLESAIEVDVDALSNGKETYVAGIMEHIEEAGIHSGDSACVLPPHTLTSSIVDELAAQAKLLAEELRVVGMMNVQFAIKDGQIYILEVNPRASRTVPFVSKASDVPLAGLAMRVMLGKSLAELKSSLQPKKSFVSVKEAVFPFGRFPGVDIILGPEMRSTGEVMGIAQGFEEAYIKALLGAGLKLPEKGRVFISVNDRDKAFVLDVAKLYAELGYELLATSGTVKVFENAGIPCTKVLKVYEGRPNIVDRIKNNEVALVINTASGKSTVQDSKAIRQTTILYGVPYFTTLSGAKTAALGLRFVKKHGLNIKSIQEYHKI
ncbi:carbamoyl-phosphate synthase large subunit [Desulfovibrio litoralis]|uniref:Carbamoyl phosphate synthase large chain n=1 Tax=Desulfovibrio litoralis DSM 11393 TaxID=1121455 RepID=A0A1M7SBI8_9BACT|nr:carbamoyl-phosphate synthase large subunit [Desulfovibrio litoralis]SHN55876.1 carbamoyl-phosphate synthase large subunit [Desulfovibrio litoralis DSM 11393]